MELLKKWIKDIFTEPDGKTVCIVRVLALIGFVYFIGAHAWSVFHLGAALNLSEFGTAFAAMIATVGGALGFKTDTPEKVG